MISASILAPIVLGCLWLGGWPLALLLLIAAIGLAIEWLEMNRHSRHPPLQEGPGEGLLGQEVLPDRFPAWGGGTLLLGIPYLVPGILTLWWLRADDTAGLFNVLFLLAIVWASDIGAYAAGRLFDGPKLAPSISPGKTWSGAAGGLIAALAVPLCFSLGLPTMRGLVVAACLGITSQAGDLLESAIKRHFGVKDSGRLIPGHGGLLDRIDGLLVAAPMAGLLAAWLGRGVVLWR